VAVEASVIVPVYLQWDLVPELLEALAAQSMAPDTFEIILVDNGPEPALGRPDAAANVRLVRCTTPGSYAARNAGVAAARGRFLAFTDADCRPQPQWLETLLAAARAEPDAVHAGRIKIRPGSARPNAYEIYEMVRGIPQRRYVARGYGVTANLMVDRQVIERVGAFDAARFSGGDAEFCRRAGKAGCPMRYAPDAVVDHLARADWDALATKTRRVRGGQLLAGSTRRRLGFLTRTFLPPLSAILRYLNEREFPLRYRLVAMGVHLRLWVVEMKEAVRLLIMRRPPERR
jgi:GT2 family glycosyltransferase